jgi:hypothetical protein
MPSMVGLTVTTTPPGNAEVEAGLLKNTFDGPSEAVELTVTF